MMLQLRALVVVGLVLCAGTTHPCSLCAEPVLEVAPRTLAFIGRVEGLSDPAPGRALGAQAGVLRLTVSEEVIGCRRGETVEVEVRELAPDCSTRPVERDKLATRFRVGSEAVVIAGPSSGYSLDLEQSPGPVVVVGLHIARTPVVGSARRNELPFDYEQNLKLLESARPADMASFHLFATLQYLKDLDLLQRTDDTRLRIEILRRIWPFFARSCALMRVDAFGSYRVLVMRYLAKPGDLEALLSVVPPEVGAALTDDTR